VAAKIGELWHELPSIDRFYYAVKANAHPAILETVAGNGLGFECASAEEVVRVRQVAGPAVPVLFTPNFCPMEEFALARVQGAEIVVDGPQVFDLAPGLFAGAELGVRIDPGRGFGHHQNVVTAGAATKFGLALDELDSFAREAVEGGARIVGLHAHVGSGILEAEAWVETGEVLLAARSAFPDARWIDLGGGLGVPQEPGQSQLDLTGLDAGLRALAAGQDGITIRLEPGRFLVSEAGVLVAPVTQVRRKGELFFAGISTGMNSLLRPALYGAWHGIHNLSRLEESPTRLWQIVGPICESSDVFGRDRRIPDPRPGDVLLVENAGAYGAVMASRYNLREPALEVAI
jgi:diaminopimelate decarboxylase/aspartate kinase